MPRLMSGRAAQGGWAASRISALGARHATHERAYRASARHVAGRLHRPSEAGLGVARLWFGPVSLLAPQTRQWWFVSGGAALGIGCVGVVLASGGFQEPGPGLHGRAALQQSPAFAFRHAAPYTVLYPFVERVGKALGLH